MTTDLARTLRDAVDGASTTYLLGHARPEADTVADLVGHLAARIRRRRAVRAGARAGVGLVTVGAIAAFGGQIVGRRGADDVLPAAVPGAAPGTCGSSVATLVPTGDAAVSATLSTAYDESGTASDVPLSPLVGRHLPAFVMLTGETVKKRSVGGVTPLPDGGTRDVVIVRGGTVVATLPATMDGMAHWTDQPGSVLRVGTESEPNLVTCATSRSAGGEPLPAGSYTAYPVVEYRDMSVPSGTARAVGAPILLTLLPPEPPLSGLPDAFPADVPIIGGRLLEASELDGTLASGWLVTVAVDGVDGVTRALDSLRGFAPRWQKISIPSSATDTVAATIGSWDVAAHAGLTDDGQSTVVYRLTPR